MLTKEQSFFLTVLADHLNGRTTVPVEGLDWKTVYEMAEQHQLSALFYVQCWTFLPPEAEFEFLRDYGMAVSFYTDRQNLAAAVDRAFKDNKIPYVIVKGLVVAKCYPQPELRSMGDMDVAVNECDKEKAHEVLLGLGFRNTRKQDCEWVYTKGSHEIELHHRLLYEDLGNTPQEIAAADRMWEYVQPVPESSRCELDPTFHFLFLLMHLKKHVVVSGAGFRQFMDIAAAAGKWQLDHVKLDKMLEETGLLAFFNVSVTFCRKWFQMDLPFKGTHVTPEYEEKAVQYIFRSGVFGFDNDENSLNYMFAQMNAGDGDCLRRRLLMCLKTILLLPPEWNRPWTALFPGYEELRKSRNYSFVDRRRWLVPFVWVYRYIHCIWFKVSHSFLILKSSRRKVKERQDFLDKMGM